MFLEQEIIFSRRDFLCLTLQTGVIFGHERFPEPLSSLEKLAPFFWYGRVKVEGLNIRPAADYLETKPAGVVKEGAVLRFENQIIQGKDGLSWYKIIKNRWLNWPSKTDEYVWAGGIKIITDFDPIHPWVNPQEKKIVIFLKNQLLIAYEGENEVLRTFISAGKVPYQTPRGEFRILYKRMERQMQGYYPNNPQNNYDLRGVPFCWYFLWGYAGHGAWWHNNFGQPMSHGCVNVPLAVSPEIGISPAEFLFRWTTPEFHLSDVLVAATASNPGTLVIIKEE